MYIMDKIALIAHYADLKAQQGQTSKGAPEYYAYHQIGTALASEDVEQALKNRIQRCHDAIAENDQRNWNSRTGYRWFYGRMIELFEKAMQEVKSDEVPNL